MYPQPQKPGPSPSPGLPQPPSTTQPGQGPRRHPDFEKNPPPPGELNIYSFILKNNEINV